MVVDPVNQYQKL